MHERGRHVLAGVVLDRELLAVEAQRRAARAEEVRPERAGAIRARPFPVRCAEELAHFSLREPFELASREQFRKDVKIPRLHADLPSLGYLAGRTLGELLTAECRATQMALSEAGRPNFTYLVPRISADTLGQLIYLFEFQTAIAGELYDIDAFDQPGVEAGKQITYKRMGRPGY